MSSADISIRGLDTLLFRDGRPFDTTGGSRAETLRIPAPSTTAGFLRRRAGPVSMTEWAGISEQVTIAGPLLARSLNGTTEALFSAPADAVVYRNEQGVAKLITLRPWSAGDLADAGCDLPGGMLPLRVPKEFKPDPSFRYWTWNDMQRWLLDAWQGDCAPEYVEGPDTDVRVHVDIGENGVAEESKLFTTEMVAFEKCRDRRESLSYLCRVETTRASIDFSGPWPMGGESRIAIIDEGASGWPDCTTALRDRLATARNVRLILATPAVFTNGWQPGWLDKTTKTGSPPGSNGAVTLKLVSAAMPRRQAVSGWDYSDRKDGDSTKQGSPKPVRWCAPAGSVYFFEVMDGDPSVLADSAWLRSMSDTEMNKSGQPVFKNQNDGFGLALWGAWNLTEDNG